MNYAKKFHETRGIEEWKRLNWIFSQNATSNENIKKSIFRQVQTSRKKMFNLNISTKEIKTIEKFKLYR